MNKLKVPNINIIFYILSLKTHLIIFILIIVFRSSIDLQFLDRQNSVYTKRKKLKRNSILESNNYVIFPATIIPSLLLVFKLKVHTIINIKLTMFVINGNYYIN